MERSLKKEINAVLDDAYHAELDLRQKSRTKGSKIIAVPPPKTAENTVVYNLDKMDKKNSKGANDDIMKIMNTAINDYISKERPLNIYKLDSITTTILRVRNIESNFVVRVLNPTTGKVLESSKKVLAGSRFLIYSKQVPLDFENKKSLQLILLNPLGNIFKRMGIFLVGAFVLSLSCFYGLWHLFRTQSRQKKLIEVKNDFFGNTAHELKRPVAQLHLALEALSKPAINENTAKRERYLAISKEATKDMSEKITMIMTLSMAEEGVFKLNYSHFDLATEVEKLKEQFAAVAGKEVDIR
ncbi:MAG TPA: histidine kinase dimerization/phospho-acceptor domain-containing protein, partial [Paludibacter sp.]|nr:histidine kinase dimerization/phospho-acceptor domain-containing protein [Paludibacter sp.]